MVYTNNNSYTRYRQEAIDFERNSRVRSQVDYKTLTRVQTIKRI